MRLRNHSAILLFAVLSQRLTRKREERKSLAKCAIRTAQPLRKPESL